MPTEKIGLKSVQSLIPPFFYTLSKISEGGLSYRYYQVRHPGAIFSRTFLDVLNSYNLLYKKVNNVQASANACTDNDRAELLSLTQEFLANLLKYFEGNYEIFLCFCPQETKPSQELYKWFSSKTYGSLVAKYFQNTNPYLKKYRELLNALKHSSNKLLILQFINPENQGSTIGFYLEGVVDEHGAIGPLPEFHPLHNDRHTAWSYNLHFKNLYFLIHKIAIEADSVVQQLIKDNKLSLGPVIMPLVSANIEQVARDAFTNAKRLNHDSFYYFPQEENEAAQTVSLSTDNSELIFEEKTQNSVLPKGSRIIVAFSGDGFSRTFGLPYFKSGE